MLPCCHTLPENKTKKTLWMIQIWIMHLWVISEYNLTKIMNTFWAYFHNFTYKIKLGSIRCTTLPIVQQKQSTEFQQFFLGRKRLQFQEWTQKSFTSSLYSWFASTWWDSPVGVQNNRKWPHKFCIRIELNSQKAFYCIALYTKMTALTSDENHQ